MATVKGRNGFLKSELRRRTCATVLRATERRVGATLKVRKGRKCNCRCVIHWRIDYTMIIIWPASRGGDDGVLFHSLRVPLKKLRAGAPRPLAYTEISWIPISYVNFELS